MQGLDQVTPRGRKPADTSTANKYGKAGGLEGQLRTSVKRLTCASDPHRPIWGSEPAQAPGCRY